MINMKGHLQLVKAGLFKLYKTEAFVRVLCTGYDRRKENMSKILLFAGTTEGRLLYEYCVEKKLPVTACVATEYGKTLLEKGDWGSIREGRLNSQQMELLMKEEGTTVIIDATHPYACDVTDNIRQAAQAAGVPLLRVIRKTLSLKGIIEVKDMKETIRFLNDNEGNALITTGSKDLKEYTRVRDYQDRLYIRILPDPDALRNCFELGYQRKNIICMQGPFHKELNYAMLKQINGKYLVTKEGGSLGGYEEKAEGGRMAGAKVIVIQRPKEETGFSVEEIMDRLAQ